MTSNLLAPISTENITVSYVDSQNNLIEGVSVIDANTYAKGNPNTVFLFLDGNNRYRYLNINQVNKLTSKDLISSNSVCDTSPKPCGPPRVIFSGGGGIGAQANPIIGPDRKLVAIDIISPGIGYQSAPRISIIDDCNTGSGATAESVIDDFGGVSSAVVIDPGSGYIPSPPKPQVPQVPSTEEPRVIIPSPTYPVLLGLKEVVVNDPGINYNPEVDVIEISPNNGTVLQGIFNSFGQVVSVKVLKPGLGFTSRPTLSIKSESGVNADLIPVFEVLRDPLLLEDSFSQSKIITVIDDIGLTVKGYINGKPYYGNIYFDQGIKYAGPFKTFEKQIRVYDTLQESILNSK